MTAEEEDERFKKQMLVDVEALGKDAEALGVSVAAEGIEGIPGWMGLRDVITRDGRCIYCHLGGMAVSDFGFSSLKVVEHPGL